MYEVKYYALCGDDKSVCQSTKELAETVAAELRITANNIEIEGKIAEDTFIFLGSSCYGGKPGGMLSEFITGIISKGDRWRYSGLH